MQFTCLSPHFPYFVHTDWLGTERERTNTGGAVAESCTTLPYGDALTCSGTDVSPLHFTGKMRDAETGLDDFPARYYSSGQGRWYSPDWASAQVPVPYADLHNPQSLNLYDYVGSDPTNHADADGHACTDSSTGCGSDQAKGAAVQASEGQAESKTAQNTAATTLPVALPSPLALPALEGVSDFALPLLPGLVALDYAVTVPPLEGAGDPMTPGYVSPPPSTSQQGAVDNSPMQSSRGQNVAPDPNALGAAHSVAKRDASGNVTGYTTFDANGNAVSRFRGQGKSPGGVEPPIVYEAKPGKGAGAPLNRARPARPEEIPQ